jgi:hypothetical protein
LAIVAPYPPIPKIRSLSILAPKSPVTAELFFFLAAADNAHPPNVHDIKTMLF